MTDPKGTVVFSTVGRTNYGFDVFSITLTTSIERRLTDGVSINFNAQFQQHHRHSSVVFVSERSGSPRIYLTRPGQSDPVHLPFIPQSLFHDRPLLKNDRLYFISAHDHPDRSFKNWPALYSCRDQEITRLTPCGVADYSPAVSESGKFIAVASYGSREWGGEFHQLNTDIVVFSETDPNTRHLVCQKGGWPTWSGDSTIYFHRQTDDGWWSIFRIDFPETVSNPPNQIDPVRITPPGVHCFTPAAFHDGKRIAVATRRRGQDFRHIEIFEVESKVFQTVTELLNPSFHHYNPSVSPDGGSIVYHRFRGESDPAELIPQFERVMSPTNDLRLLRINGNFPAFSASGDFVAFNQDFDRNGGVKVVRWDGSKRWTLIKGRTAFYNAWSPADSSVVFTSLGPIFESAKATVQIARISFDPSDLNDDHEEEVPCEVKILTRDDTGNNAFPSVSPDGKSLVFRSGRSGDKNLFIVDAVNGEFDGGGIRQLTNGPWIDTMPSWSPRGDLIAFSSNRHNPDDPSKFSIYTVKPDGSDARRIKVAAGGAERERINHVCFSGDGEWLLFAANLGGVTAEPVSLPNQFQPYGDLFVTRVDGSGLRRITWNGYENGTPAWHPKPDVVELGSLSLEKKGFDELRGEFQEPLWITSDF